MQGTARAGFVAGALGALLLALCVGSGAPLVVSFDVPDSAVFEGMREDRDRGGRWTGSIATLEPGVVAVGEVEVRVTCDRGGRSGTAALTVRQGDEERRLTVGADPALARLPATGLVVVQLATGARREFGVRLQSLTAEPKGPLALLPSPGRVVRMAAGSALLTLALALAGFTPFMSAAASVLLWSLPVSLLGWTNPYTSLRLVDTLWLIAPLFAFGLGALKRSLGAPGVLLGVAAALIRLMLLFHPSFYFGDLEIHLGVTRALRDEGRVHGWVHMDKLQQRFDLGRARVSGAMRPLPYPPMFHTLSSLGPDGVEVPMMKSLAVGAETAAILLTFLLGRRLFGSEAAGVMAGLALNLLPWDTLELLRVSFPAILGRTLDLAGLLWLVSRSSDALASARGRLQLGAWLALCCLCYNASPVHWGLFIPLALLTLVLPPAQLRDARSLLAAAVIGGALSLLYYGRYLLDVAFNVLPGSREAAPSISVISLVATLAQINGPVVFAAVAAIPLCLVEAWRRRESRLLLAWILWVPLLIHVATSFPEPFGYFRRHYFAYPLLAVLASRWAKTPSLLARALALILVGWGLLEIARFIPGIYLTHTGRIGE